LTSTVRKRVEVVAAAIKSDRSILCVQRPVSDKPYISMKWEFPGGKIEAGESLEEALIREIREELSVDIAVEDLIDVVEHSYPDFDITMHVFFCRCVQGEITLREHLAHRWLVKETIADLDWAEADVPIVKKLENIL